jgi:hypothetical protein
MTPPPAAPGVVPADRYAPIPCVDCPADVLPLVEGVQGIHVSGGEIVAVIGMHIVTTAAGYCITSRDPKEVPTLRQAEHIGGVPQWSAVKITADTDAVVVRLNGEAPPPALLTEAQVEALEAIVSEDYTDGWINGLDDILREIGIPVYPHTRYMLETARWLLAQHARVGGGA